MMGSFTALHKYVYEKFLPKELQAHIDDLFQKAYEAHYDDSETLAESVRLIDEYYNKVVEGNRK